MPDFPIPTFDAFTLAAVVEELRRLCIGARVQKIQQPSPTEIILSVYGKAGSQRILLCADPKSFRLHITQSKRANPVNAPAFCGACRKRLDGAFLSEILQPRFDRVVRLVFLVRGGEPVTLMAELMGRNSNLALTSGEGIIRAVLRPMPADSPRPLKPGEVYADPPGYGERPDPLAALTTGAVDALPEEFDAARETIQTGFGGIGKFGAEEVLARARRFEQTPAAALRTLLEDVAAGRFFPHSVSDVSGKTLGVWAFPPYIVPEGLRHARESVSVALDTFYAVAAERSVSEEAQTNLSRALRAEIKFREKEIVAADATLREADRAERYEQLGNNLLAAMYRLEKGATSASVPDLYSEDGAEIPVPLDPVKSPQENVESYFTRARKARDAALYAERRKTEVSEQLARLKSLTAALENAAPADLPGLQSRLTEIVGAERAGASSAPAARRPAASPRPFGGFRIRTYAIGDYMLLVGESAEANDHLTTRIASPSDWWFHVRSAPGAHGVLRAGGKPDRVPESALRRAAEIVAARSSAVKHSGIVAVDIVEKRHVRKPRGAKPGLVTYDKERTIDVEPKL